MKLRFRRRTLLLSWGDKMWRCTNGWQNYRHEISLYLRWRNDWTMGGGRPHVPHALAITPFLNFWPWHKSTLASDPTLGNTHRSAALELEWMGFTIGLCLGFNVQTKKSLCWE